jgi:hypothetical protein
VKVPAVTHSPAALQAVAANLHHVPKRRLASAASVSRCFG